MDNSGKTSTQYLEELLSLENVKAVVVIGRDGFVIESVGGARAIELDALGASVAGAIMRIENMGSELEIDKYKDLFVEYGKAMIMGVPIGDAIVTVVASDSSSLGMIRYKFKKMIPFLEEFF
jgi:predicted regulator of Ras-like GTPase activity (Roadblock/LC7/MglB family)